MARPTGGGMQNGKTVTTGLVLRVTETKEADKILVLTECGIEESGTHEELIKKNGIYKKLYKLYEE